MKFSKPLFIFYLLVGYVFLQFMQWTYQMVKQNNEIYRQHSELITIRLQESQEGILAQQKLTSELHRRWLMIIGEGSVFMALMILGIIKIKKTFASEAALAAQQNNFLLSVTHELKSPLASTKLQLQTLLKRDMDKVQQKEIINHAIIDTERLNHLVENILLTTKIANLPGKANNSQYPLHKESTLMDEFIKKILSSGISSNTIKQKVILNLEQGINLNIDRINFPSIILNLLENATKYAPEYSTLTIVLEKKEKKIMLTFKDEGSGIPDEEKQNIFKKFYRIGNEETRRTKGTGLGLYIVKYLVEQHEGQISVKNNAPRGSIFEVAFSPWTSS